ncbi:MAG: ribonuclease III [Clostridia bacterium]|nr:ribonuclease III [Clostridia bacterium]
MEHLTGAAIDPSQMNPLSLAFVGDGVYELFVRETMVQNKDAKVRDLHTKAVSRVRCEAQAKAAREVLLPVLTEEEQAVYNRGRNAHVGHVPKNASIADYHAATAVEALFGYLYLKGELARLRELFALCATTFE